MSRQQITRLLRFLGFSIFLGSIVSIIVSAAGIIAAYNIPAGLPQRNDAVTVYAIVLIVLASLLATAPLIEWWYNYLSERFGITWIVERSNEVGSDDEKN